MAAKTAKTADTKVPTAEDAEAIPSDHELLLDRFIDMGFVLVQWIGSKTIWKLAPSPTGTVRKYGSTNYGLVGPKQFMLVHKADARAGKMYYRSLTAKEKPDKSKVKLIISGTKGTCVRVTWPGMPVDDLDALNRLPM